MKNWYELGQRHSHIHIKADKCFYAREYKPRQGYGGSQTNQLILNFKKSPDKQSSPLERKYRIKAVKTFARESERLFPLDSNISVTAIPSSKRKSDPQYDNRFEDFFKELLKARPNLNIEWPVEIKETIQASHHGGRRNPEDLKRNYIWRGFTKTPKALCVFDDILTTGAHFRSVSDFLKENGYKGQIIGIFWARSIRDD